MVIGLFREKSIISIFALLFCTLLMHLHIFNAPVHFEIAKNSGALSFLLSKYQTKLNPTIVTIFYPILIFFQALRLNIILNNNRMYAKAGFTAAFAYVLLTALLPKAFVLSPALIINSIIILLFSLVVKLYNNSNAKALIFNIGFLSAVLVIAYYPCVVLVVFSLFALAILRPFKPTEWFILLLGCIAPFYLFFSISYLCNFNFHQIVLYKVFFKILVNTKDVWTTATLAILGLLALCAFVTWYSNINKLVIQIRKNWGVVLILFIFTLAAIPFYSKHNMLPEIITLVPAAAFLANFFVYPKKTIFINFVILIAIVIVVYNNYLLW